MRAKKYVAHHHEAIKLSSTPAASACRLRPPTSMKVWPAAAATARNLKFSRFSDPRIISPLFPKLPRGRRKFGLGACRVPDSNFRKKFYEINLKGGTSARENLTESTPRFNGHTTLGNAFSKKASPKIVIRVSSSSAALTEALF